MPIDSCDEMKHNYLKTLVHLSHLMRNLLSFVKYLKKLKNLLKSFKKTVDKILLV